MAARLVCNTSPQYSLSSCSIRLCQKCTSLSRVQAYQNKMKCMHAGSLYKLPLAECPYIHILELGVMGPCAAEVVL